MVTAKKGLNIMWCPGWDSGAKRGGIRQWLRKSTHGMNFSEKYRTDTVSLTNVPYWCTTLIIGGNYYHDFSVIAKLF